MGKLDKLLDDLVEAKYQLRLEHNHGDMKWYAYFAGRGGRKLFESDLYSDGDLDWLTAGDTPLEAVIKLTGLNPSSGDKLQIGPMDREWTAGGESHQHTIPVEFEYQRKIKVYDKSITVMGMEIESTIDDKNGEWHIINRDQATRKVITKLRCSCGDEVER